MAQQMTPVIPGTYTPVSGASALLAQPATASPTPFYGTYIHPTQIPSYTPALPTGARLGSGAPSSSFNIAPYAPMSYEGLPSVDPSAGMGEFRRGVNRGFEQLQATAYGFPAVVSDLINRMEPPEIIKDVTTSIRDWGYEGYERNIEEASKYAKTVERIENINSLGSAASWVTGTTGELIPNILGLLLPGGIAAGIGKAVAPTVIKGAAAETVGALVAKGMTEKAAIAAVNKAMIRKLALTATGATSAAIESGSNWGQSATRFGIGQNDPLLDLGFGIASGLTDVLLGAEGNVLRSILGRPISGAADQALRKGITTGILSTAGQESLQEGLQEILSITNQHLQAHDTSITEDDLSDVLNAMAAGFVGGTVMSPTTVMDIRRHNRMVDARNAANTGVAGTTGSTGSTTAENRAPLVDKESIQQGVIRTQLQPYALAREQRAEMLAAEEERVNQEIADINFSWQERIDNERIALDRIQQRVTAIEDTTNPNNPYAGRPEEREKVLRNLKYREVAKINARVAALEKDRDAAIQQRYKQYGEYDTRTQTIVRKGAEQQWKVDSERRSQQFANDPTVVENLDTISTEVATFSNRENDSINTRIRKINDAIEETQRALDVAIEESQRGGRPIPEHAVTWTRDHVSALNKEKRNAIKTRRELRRLAEKIIKNITTATDATLGQINNDIAELYSMANLTPERLRNKDLLFDGILKANKSARETLKGIADRIKIDRESLATSARFGDPISRTADNILHNAAIAATAGAYDTSNISSDFDYVANIREGRLAAERMDRQRIENELALAEASRRAADEETAARAAAELEANIMQSRNVEYFNRLNELQQASESVRDVIEQEDSAIDRIRRSRQRDAIAYAESVNYYNTPEQVEPQQRRVETDNNAIVNTVGATFPRLQFQGFGGLMAGRDLTISRDIASDAAGVQTRAELDQTGRTESIELQQQLTEESIPEEARGEITPEQIEQAQQQQEQQALSDRPVAQEASTTQQVNGSGIVEGRRLTSNARQVRGWLSNAFKSLPVLEQNTIIAVDGRDISIPVELQNKIYDITTKTGSHPIGAYFNGKVYIFANMVSSKQEAIRALVHEGIGHFGLRCIFTPAELNQFLNLVHDSFNGTTAWSNFIARNPESFQGMDRMRQAEEFVAYFAQSNQPAKYLRGPAVNAFRRLQQFITRILNKLGFERVTKADLQDVLSASAHFLANSNNANVYESSDTSLLRSNGVETVSPPTISTGKAWGVYFNSMDQAASYNTSLANNVSGIPGTYFDIYTPSENNFINLEATLNEQPTFIKEMLPVLIDENAASLSPTGDGMIQLSFLGKDMGVFENQEAAYELLSNDDVVLSELSGQDLYDYLSSQNGSQKSAGLFLRDLGILGATMSHLDTTTHVLFTGDEAALNSQNPDIPYTEPMFMQEDVEQNFTVADTGTVSLSEDTPVKNETMLSIMSQKYSSRLRWADVAREVKRTGISRNAEGKFEYSMFERATEFLADRYRPIQLMQRFLEETIPAAKKVVGEGLINYRTNIYKMLTGLNNRIHARQIEIHDEFVNPLIKQVQDIVLPTEVLEAYNLQNLKPGSSEYMEAVYAALGDYVWSRHAPERNAEVNRRLMSQVYYETLPDGTRVRRAKKSPNTTSSIINPSGLSDARAAEIFDTFDSIPGMREAAELVDRINAHRINLLEEFKLINKTTADNLRATYNYYVPIQNWTDIVDSIAPDYYSTHRNSAGISVGGKSMVQYATGRSGVPNNPVVQSILQLYDTAAIGVKNNVSRGLLELVRTAPDPDLWEVSGKEPGLFRITKNKEGELTFRQKSHKLEGEGFKQILVVDEDANVVRISIKDDRFAKSLRGENLAPTGPIINFIRTWTSRMSQLQTSLNPAFIASNPIRDLETAIINMGNILSENEKRDLVNAGENLRRNILKDATSKKQFKFLKSIIEGRRTDAELIDPQMFQEYLDFSANGGHTRMFDVGNFEANYKALIAESKKDTGSMAFFKNAVRYIDNMSNVTENITRFSVYRNVQKAFEKNIRDRAKASGFDSAWVSEQIKFAKQKSANIALESTVNFTRKGSGASVFNALYAFSSATIQGSVRIMQNLWRRGDTTANNMKRLGKYIAMGTMGGFMQGMLNRMWMDDDDDGINKYDKIPSFEKYRSAIIPNPIGDGGYLKLPLAYGYNIFWTLGIVLDDIINGNKKAPSALADIFKESIGAFSPVDPIDEGFTAFVPTLLRPLAQVAANTTFSGIPIYPENTGKTIPDSQKYWAKTPEGYKLVARFLNDPMGMVFGGGPNTFESKFIDVSPESIEHVFTSYLGGVGRVLTDTVGLLSIPAGAEARVSRMPILNRFYGDVSYSNTAALYNRVAGQIEQSRNAMELVRNDRSLTPQRANALIQEYQGAYNLTKLYSSTQKQLSAIRKEEKAIGSRYIFNSLHRDYNERTRKNEQRKEDIMKRFLRAANRAGLAIQEGN